MANGAPRIIDARDATPYPPPSLEPAMPDDTEYGQYGFALDRSSFSKSHIWTTAPLEFEIGVPPQDHCDLLTAQNFPVDPAKYAVRLPDSKDGKARWTWSQPMYINNMSRFQAPAHPASRDWRELQKAEAEERVGPERVAAAAEEISRIQGEQEQAVERAQRRAARRQTATGQEGFFPVPDRHTAAELARQFQLEPMEDVMMTGALPAPVEQTRIFPGLAPLADRAMAGVESVSQFLAANNRDSQDDTAATPTNRGNRGALPQTPAPGSADTGLRCTKCVNSKKGCDKVRPVCGRCQSMGVGPEGCHTIGDKKRKRSIGANGSTRPRLGSSAAGQLHSSSALRGKHIAVPPPSTSVANPGSSPTPGPRSGQDSGTSPLISMPSEEASAVADSSDESAEQHINPPGIREGAVTRKLSVAIAKAGAEPTYGTHADNQARDQPDLEMGGTAVSNTAEEPEKKLERPRRSLALQTKQEDSEYHEQSTAHAAASAPVSKPRKRKNDPKQAKIRRNDETTPVPSDDEGLADEDDEQKQTIPQPAAITNANGITTFTLASSFSDGTGNFPSKTDYSQNDDWLNKALAERWAKELGYPKAQEYRLDRLPSGFALYERKRAAAGNHMDREIVGYPKKRYVRSLLKFWPHFLWMQNGGTGSCECDCCPKKKEIARTKARAKKDDTKPKFKGTDETAEEYGASEGNTMSKSKGKQRAVERDTVAESTPRRISAMKTPRRGNVVNAAETPAGKAQVGYQYGQYPMSSYRPDPVVESENEGTVYAPQTNLHQRFLESHSGSAPASRNRRLEFLNAHSNAPSPMVFATPSQQGQDMRRASQSGSGSASRDRRMEFLNAHGFAPSPIGYQVTPSQEDMRRDSRVSGEYGQDMRRDSRMSSGYGQDVRRDSERKVRFDGYGDQMEE